MVFTVSEPYTCEQIDARARDAWARDGVLRITGLIPPAWFEHLRGRLANVLGDAPESPQVWRALATGPLKPLGRDKRCVALEVDAVKTAVDSLLGAGWEYPQTGGGWFANGPRELERQHETPMALAPRGNWHWDGRPDLHAINGLWLFTPVVTMLPHSGGTWMVAGSARQVLAFYRALSPEQTGKPTKVVKKWFSEAHDWFRVLNGDEPFAAPAPTHADDAVRLVNVAGQPGDVVMMQNFTVHSAPDYIGPGARLCQVTVAAHMLDEHGNRRST